MNQIPSDNRAMNTDQAPSNAARRRLTRGGLALPVVLASVVSRNAFAATPYSCSISGQLSGNMSVLGPDKGSNQSCSMRAGRSELTSRLQRDETSFSSVFGEKYFANGNNAVANKLSSERFKGSGKGDADKADKRASQDATLFQVLKLNDFVSGAKPKDPEFAKMAVVAYTNATAGPSDLYPLTKQQVVAMFKAAVNNRDYQGKTSMGAFTWKPNEVRGYFEQLYH